MNGLPSTVRANAYPWALIVAFVALSAWANRLHADGAAAQYQILAALVPVSAAFAWHLLVLPNFDGTDRGASLRRLLARVGAAVVFGWTMVGSWDALVVVGERARLEHPTALPVAVDGLVFVAALAVWSHRRHTVQTATEMAVRLDPAERVELDQALAALTAELDTVRQSIPAPAPAGVGQGDLDTLRSSVLDEVQSRLDRLAQSNPESNRKSKPSAAKPEPARSPEYTEAVRLLRASGVVRATAYNRANAAERDGRLAELIAELRTPRAVEA